MSQAPTSQDVVHGASTEADRSDERSGRRTHIGSLLLVVWLVGFAASLGANIMAKEWDIQNRRAHFSRLAHEELHEIRMQIVRVVDSVRAIRGLYNASVDVDREEFHAFVESLEVAAPVQALAWVPRVPNKLRAEYERTARQGSFPGFEFTERGRRGSMARSGDRDEYFPIYFLEPYGGNEKALGFDLGSDAIRLAALNKAGASGREVATGRITLVQETGEQYGFLIAVPIYRDGVTPATDEQRKSELVGFSLGAFRTGDLVSAALFEDDSAHSPIEIHVFDKSTLTDPQLLYTKASGFEPSVDLQSGLREEEVLHFASREWLIVATPTEGSVYAHDSFVPWLVLAFGLMMTTLTAMWCGAIVSRNDYANQLLAAHSAELFQANREREPTSLG